MLKNFGPLLVLILLTIPPSFSWANKSTEAPQIKTEKSKKNVNAQKPKQTVKKDKVAKKAKSNSKNKPKKKLKSAKASKVNANNNRAPASVSNEKKADKTSNKKK